MDETSKVLNPAAWLGRMWDRMPAASGSSTLTGWAATFRLDPSDPRLLDAVRAVFVMVDRARAAVAALPFPETIRQHYLRWPSAFDEVMVQTVANGAWSNVRHRFTPVLRENLQSCELWLDSVSCSEAEARTELNEIAKNVHDLLLEVRQCQDIDEDFRVLLIDILESLHRAIVEYDLRGFDGIQASLGEILGFALRRFNDLKTKNDNGFVDRIFEVLKKAAVVMSVAKYSTEAALALHRLLIEHAG